MRRFRADRIVFFIIGIVAVVALVFIGVVAVNESKADSTELGITSFRAIDSQKPRATIVSTSSDMGTMSVKEEKAAEFTIDNTGDRPLQLFRVSTSCDCTFASLTIEGNVSPEFSMHSKNPWVGNVDPGKSARLTVIYRPSVMPVQGPVSRDIYVSTNDPDNPKLTFTIKAVVE